MRKTTPMRVMEKSFDKRKVMLTDLFLRTDRKESSKSKGPAAQRTRRLPG